MIFSSILGVGAWWAWAAVVAAIARSFAGHGTEAVAAQIFHSVAATSRVRTYEYCVQAHNIYIFRASISYWIQRRVWGTSNYWLRNDKLVILSEGLPI